MRIWKLLLSLVRVSTQCGQWNRSNHLPSRKRKLSSFLKTLNVRRHVPLSLGSCSDVQCETDLEPLPAAQARAQDKDVYSTEGASSDEGVLMASTTVFVRDPGDEPSKYTLPITVNRTEGMHQNDTHFFKCDLC